MNAFKKLALAAAVASVPMVGVAMEPLNDEGLSNVTGQDGITLGITLEELALNVYIEDTDGLQDGSNRDEGGLIAIRDLVVSTGSDEIVVKIDAGSATGAAASGGSSTGVLRVGVDIEGITLSGPTSGEGFSIGVAGVSDSGTDSRIATAGWSRVEGALAEYGEDNIIMSINEVALSGVGLNIELGPEAQAMTLNLDGEIASIELNDFKIGPSNAQVGVDQILVRTLDLEGTTGEVTAGGLTLTLGAGLSSADVALMGVKIGDSNADYLGNVYVDGLDMSNTKIRVAGH